MKKIKIVTDTSSDLTQDYYRLHDIGTVPFFITFDKHTYYKEHIDISNVDFYKKLRSENVYPSTSTPNAQQYRDAFKSSVENNTDIICLCISSKFSASYQSALLAAEELKAEYPENRIAVIDSIQACCGQGLILNEIVKMRDSGLNIDEIISKTEECKHSARLFITVDSLEYLSKGGRVGKSAALAGSVLNIKPVIVMREGELMPACKVRGRQKSIQKIHDLAIEYIGTEKEKYDIITFHADCMDEAENISRLLVANGYSSRLGVNQAGVTIGAHTGPTLIGIAIIKRICN